MRMLSTLPQNSPAPYFVVSPHLDDAVFSCAMLLASWPGSIVCTVFCGEPAPPQRTPWDSEAGHRDSSEALRARVSEDERALAIVRAHGIRLPFLDSQYGCTPSVAEIADALTHAWRRSGAPSLVAPLGLYHSDHVLVADACRELARRARLPTVILYEDALYRTNRAIARQRYASLSEEGCRVLPLADAVATTLRRPGSANAKWRAVRAYRSQLRAFADPHPHDLVEPERYKIMVIDQA